MRGCVIRDERVSYIQWKDHIEKMGHSRCDNGSFLSRGGVIHTYKATLCVPFDILGGSMAAARSNSTSRVNAFLRNSDRYAS